MDRRWLLPVFPGWEAGTDAEEIRERVAAVRHQLLSEFYEAIPQMVILPKWCDLQTAQGAAHEEFRVSMYYFLSGPDPGSTALYRRTTEAEKIYRAIQELRMEIQIYRDWGVKFSAEEHRITEMHKTVLDIADKFLSGGKNILDGYGQITDAKNTVRIDSHKNEDSLDALSNGMVQFSEETHLNGSADSMNGPYSLYMANYCGVRATGCIMEGLCLLNQIVDPYESRCISEKPKPQSANTGSAGKDVHGLTGTDTENHCVLLGSTDSIDKMEFPRFHSEDIVRRIWAYNREDFIGACSVVHADLPLIQINTCMMGMMQDIDAIQDVTLHKDRTCYVEREASLHCQMFMQFSAEASLKGDVDMKIGSHKIHVLKYDSVHRPIIQLPPSARIMECVTVPYIVVDCYETGHTSEKPKPQSANTGSAFKHVHGLTDAEPENHGMFVASTNPMDKMEGQPWRDCRLMSWAARQILFLECLYASVMFTLRIWTKGILEDPTEPFKHGDQTSFVGSEVGNINIFYIPGVISVHLILTLKFQRVHHQPLVQMVPFACTLYDGTLACVKSIVPKGIVDVYELDCINQKPKLQSTNPNVDKHGAADSADCRIIEAEVKTAATWLIDTGAVHHATGNISLLSGVTIVNDDDLFITARDGIRMRVHAQGSVITDTLVLLDVWYIPGLTKNVVSASQLNQLGYSIGFTRGTCFIGSATDGTLIGKAHVSEDGLFETDFLKIS